MTDGLPAGVVVPMTTPFVADGELDRAAFRAEAEWLVGCGVHGLVVGGSTGEGYALDQAELVALAQDAVAVSAGRVPVLASIIADSTRTVTSRAGALAHLPMAALQVAPPHYIFPPGPAELIAFYRAAAEASGMPMVVYNVVPWAHVSPEQAAAIMAEVPAVQAIKQSARDMGEFVALVQEVGGRRVYGAIDAALMGCYELGALGSIAAIASAAPGASVRLWDAVQAGRRAEALALHAGLARLWSTLAGPNLPARVKSAQALQGVPSGHPRAPMAPTPEPQRAAIAAALAALQPVPAPLDLPTRIDSPVLP